MEALGYDGLTLTDGAHESGYTRRSLVETAMSRYEAIVGSSMRSSTVTALRKPNVEPLRSALGCVVQQGRSRGRKKELDASGAISKNVITESYMRVMRLVVRLKILT